MKNVIEVIVERCLGCHTCELECALAHSESDTFVQAVQSGERLFPRIILERDGESTVPMHCRHCTDAPCITVCPTTAMTRRSIDDPVVLDVESCIGCHACVLACPFGVIQEVKPEKFLTKCDLCEERLEFGALPACASACPTKAIRYIPVENLTGERRKEVLEKFKVSLLQSDKLKD